MRKRLAILVLGLAILGTAGVAAQDPPLTKVRVAFDGFSMTSAPLYYATQKGLFRQFGLDITPVFVEGGSTLTHALVGGSIDIAQNGYTPVAAAAVQGADIAFIGGISNKLPFQLVVKSSITSGQQLKGQAIAISRYGSSTDTAAEFALSHLGLTRNDVKILQLGGPATRIAATLSGQIAGTMEQYPDTAELAGHGFHVLVDLTDIAGDYPNTSYLTSRAYNPRSVFEFSAFDYSAAAGRPLLVDAEIAPCRSSPPTSTSLVYWTDRHSGAVRLPANRMTNGHVQWKIPGQPQYQAGEERILVAEPL